MSATRVEERRMAVQEAGVDDGVERLLRLLWLFRTEGTVRTNDEIEACGYPDISGESSAGRKNFANDRERLNELGISLVSHDSGWRVETIADALDSVLTDEERAAVSEAELLMDAAGEELPVVTRQSGPACLPLLLGAAIDRHHVLFGYDGKDRRVDPYRVVASRQGHWYLHGFEEHAQADRIFRIDRIEDLDRNDPDHPAMLIDRSTRSKRTKSAAVSVHPSTWSLDPPVDAVVRFEHEPLPEWIAMLGPPLPLESAGGVSGPEGPVERRWRTSNHDAFVSRLLAIGPAAQLIGPPELLVRLVRLLRAHLAVSLGAHDDEIENVNDDEIENSSETGA